MKNRSGSERKEQCSLITESVSVYSSQPAADHYFAPPNWDSDVDDEVDSGVVRDELIASDKAGDQVVGRSRDNLVQNEPAEMSGKCDDLVKTVVVK